MSASEITASVEPPSPMTKRPPLFAVCYWSGSQWTLGFGSDSESWVRMMGERYPHSSIVTIPGEARHRPPRGRGGNMKDTTPDVGQVWVRHRFLRKSEVRVVENLYMGGVLRFGRGGHSACGFCTEAVYYDRWRLWAAKATLVKEAP